MLLSYNIQKCNASGTGCTEEADGAKLQWRVETVLVVTMSSGGKVEKAGKLTGLCLLASLL